MLRLIQCIALLALAAAALSTLSAAHAYDGVVEKKVFTLPSYTTLNGAVIKDVKVGWESYGTLNAARDNAILICHFFSANSHAAGKYKAEDKAVGYWDSIIGAGRPIDTDRYFVVSVDSLVNLNSKDGITVTTGPASISPDTGRPYGMSFPLVTIPDFVRVQKALLDSLGIKRLAMVGGPSMGGLQAYEWAAAYPETVERILPAIAAPSQSPYLFVALDLWGASVRMDPNWKNGNYYGGPEPAEGVALGFYNIFVTARHPEYVEKVFGAKWADAAKNPLAAMDNRFAVETAFQGGARARAMNTTDANHLLYMVKANQLFVSGYGSSVDAELKKVKAKALVIAARTDLVFPPEGARKTVEQLRRNGNQVEYFEIDSPGGHIAGITDITQAGDRIRELLRR